MNGVRISVEFLSEPGRIPVNCHVARVPVAGDFLIFDDESLLVKAVYLRASIPWAPDAQAIVRVTR